MGASCVRDCERTAHELYTSEDALRVQAGMPGLSPVGQADQNNRDVKVGAAFANPMAAITGRGSDGSAERTVPPLFGMKALQQVDNATPRGSPRFDEVTPRHSSVPPETYRSNPGASPRDSPRPADERRQEVGPVELSYEGDLVDDMKHGLGKLRMQGSTYEGDFKKDVKSGQGILTWDDGRQYRGQFEENKFHGSAIMTWPDGRKYSGQYLEDRKHGEGTFSWQDGRRYQGQWVVGKRHGVGIYTNAKGLTRTGLWQMDRPLHWEAPNAPSMQVSSVQSAQAAMPPETQAPETTPENAEDGETQHEV